MIHGRCQRVQSSGGLEIKSLNPDGLVEALRTPPEQPGRRIAEVHPKCTDENYYYWSVWCGIPVYPQLWESFAELRYYMVPKT